MNQTLFSQGYRCKLIGADVLLVSSPAGAFYRVTLGGLCNCPAGMCGRNCKHSRERANLAMAQSEAVYGQACTAHVEADKHKEYFSWGGVRGWDETGERKLQEARDLTDKATALFTWAHRVAEQTAVETVQAQAA